MIDFKTTTVKIPSNILIKIKTLAVEKGTTQNNIINELINRGLQNAETKKGKIKARKINHEMPFYNPDKKGNLKNIVGIVKLDHETDAVKVKNSIYTDKGKF